MTENQLEFFQLLQNINLKIQIYKYQHDQDFSSMDYKKIQKKYYEKLELELIHELSIISKTFNTTHAEALVLGMIIHFYLKYGGVKTIFITFSDIKRCIDPDFEINYYEQFRDSIFKLQDQNLIEIKDAEFYLVRIINKSDRQENDYYLLPAKPSFVPFANKNFELTQSTIDKIKNL